MKNEESECRIIIIMKVVKKSKFEIDKYNCFMRKKRKIENKKNRYPSMSKEGKQNLKE